MENKYILDSDTFVNLDKRKQARKHLAQKMIIDSYRSKIKERIIKTTIFCSCLYIVGIHAKYITG